jgi:choline-glycine betaine transporter
VLLVGGGESLQVAAVLTGGPFAVLSLVALVGLTLAFRRHERDRPPLVARLRAAGAAVGRLVGVPRDDG